MKRRQQMNLISFIISFALCALCRNPQEGGTNVITNILCCSIFFTAGRLMAIIIFFLLLLLYNVWGISTRNANVKLYLWLG